MPANSLDFPTFVGFTQSSGSSVGKVYILAGDLEITDSKSGICYFLRFYKTSLVEFTGNFGALTAF
jgi:hypothetical protein